MKIGLVHNALLPVQAYGGTERVVWWLAKGLSELGLDVTLYAHPQTQCPFAKTIDYHQWDTHSQTPHAIDFLHFFNTPPKPPTPPYLVTIEGNGKPGEVFDPNTVFVSKNHAQRHGATAFVYNGVDPQDYPFHPHKHDEFAFLAKASWRVKNVRGALRIAKKLKHPVHILGGKKMWRNHTRWAHWHGMVGGEQKVQWLSQSKALLFPVLWHEPFGIAMVEALLCGTPVLGSPFGSLPEIVPPEVGFLADSEEALVEGAFDHLHHISARDCRDWAMENFHYQKMASEYLTLYQSLLNSSTPLHPHPPQAPSQFPQGLLNW